MNILSALLLILIIDTSILSAQAITNAKKVSVKDCFAIAMSQNFDIKLAKSSVNSAASDVTAAFGFYLPSITYSMGYSRQLTNIQPFISGGFIYDNANQYNMSAFASMTIFDGFSRENNYERSRNMYDASVESVEQTMQDVMVQIYRQYVEVIRNSRLVQVQKENLELGRQDYERIKAQVEVGTSQIGLLYTQEAELGNREINLITAENTYAISKTAILATMGLDPNLEYDFLEDGIPNDVSAVEMANFRRAIGSFDNIIANAISLRKDIKASKLRREATENSVNMARTGYFPSLFASGGWQWGNTQFDSFAERGFSSVGLNLRVPIFDQFQTNNRIQSAQLQLVQSETELNRAEQNIKMGIKNAYLTLEASEKQLEVSLKSLKAAEMNYDIMSERFRVGSSGILDLYSANNQLINAKINKVNAVSNYYLAQKELLYQMGDIEKVY